VQEIITLSKELPSHSDQLIKILESLLSSYIEACQNAYSGIVQPESEDKGVISATWIKDEDIQRLLKSLPNWLKLQKSKDKKMTESMDESPEDVRSQNLRESDLLTGVFNGKTVQKHEILTDSKQIEQLAHLQESLEWFSKTVTEVATILERDSNPQNQVKNHVHRIHEMVASFRNLSDVCLLVLHLEVRVHCFHFLMPMAQQGEFSPGVDSQNADPEVTKLTRDLLNFQQILNSSLQSVKTKVSLCDKV
jgi:exocyst complex component 4